MTEEFSLSSSLLLSHIFHFCFFLLSHPLYFSYFIFFFPCLLRLIYFLSPLFTTTFLLLLAFFSLSPAHAHGGVLDQDRDGSPSESKMGLPATSYQPVSGHENEEFHYSEGLEWYNIVFETCRLFETREIAPVEVLEVQVEIDCSSQASESVIFVDKNPSHGKEDSKPDQSQPELEMEQEKKERENTTSSMMKNPDEVESDKEDDEEITQQIESEAETKDIEMVSNYKRENDSSKVEVEERDSEAVEMKITSFGSTRKEMTWRKSLACKLFEERYNVEVGNEEMDLLWETYETKESMGKVEDKSSSKKKDLSSWVNQKETEEEDQEVEEEGEEGKICCLQALKFSTGKMRFGMGKRSSLMKITKAFKGFKLLHQLTNNGKNRKTHS